MKRISCSCTWGKGNINHNFNKHSRERQEHINSSKTGENIVLRGITSDGIEREFNKIFEKDVDDYNRKQKRNDRKISNYYQKCLNDKRIKYPFREVIYQIGNREDAENPVIKEKMIRALQKFYTEFEKKYVNLKIIRSCNSYGRGDSSYAP